MQRRSRTAGLAIVVALAAVQLACGRTSSESKATDADAGSIPGGDAVQSADVDVTGCVERGAIPGSFVLTHASPESGGGASGSAGAGSDATYTVMAGDGSDLGRFVGKRVAVKGRFAVVGDPSGRGTGPTGTSGADAPPGTPGVPGSRGSSPGTTGSGASAATGDSAAATAGPAAVPTRQMTAVRVREIADTCAPQ
jgi:hypothetical protein